MSQLIHTYIAQIQAKFDTGQSTEHSFRKALESLLEELNPSISALNESQRITGVGMPDFTIKDRDNPTINIGWIEAKDLYVDLSESKNKDQLGRYLKAFDNFVYTNNLTFNFYRNGKMVDSVSLGTATRSAITRDSSDLFADNISKLEHLLQDFLAHQGQTITSSEKLARAMAQKAQLIKYAIQTIFANEETESNLTHQYTTFKDYLVHDLTTDQFADMYAQTIAYGLFTARLHDPTLQTFSRAEAERLIPKSTPFIRRLFKQMSSDDTFDDRVAHIVDDLVAIFLHCNVEELLTSYNAETGRDDPIIHFYETFLGEYDAAMRKKRGVYYTPEPVVKFIVRGVDHLLKSEFGLSQGLADTSKIEHTFTEQGKKIKKSVHRVQVLDPATGTGTFLDETIKYIHQTYFANQSGIWNGYVSNDLLPRIWGFEILMASYTMAHLKLGITLGDTGWTGDDERFNIYLTNSLEEPHGQLGSLFATQLAKESEQASRVKNEQPIMVVMGNPPYSGESSNKGDWIMDLMDEYKKEPGGKEKLKERNSKRINDDYVKFIRYAEQFVEKNKEGIVAYICPHGFLDNPTFRGMRWKIMSTFDKIYTIDLHGNSKKKEVSPDGSKDENVFDIQQGVAITFFVKTGNKKKSALAEVQHVDLYGDRKSKYDWLQENTLQTINFQGLKNVAPNYFMVMKDFGLQKKYDTYISVNNLFPVNGIGMTTAHDKFVIDGSKNSLQRRFEKFRDSAGNAKELHKEFDVKEKTGWNILDGWNNLQQNKDIASYITPISYRPFDDMYIMYEDKLVRRTVRKVMQHFIQGKNLGLVTSRQCVGDRRYVFTSKYAGEFNLTGTAGRLGSGSYFPLYLYPDEDTLMSDGRRTANLDMDILGPVLEKLGAEWLPDGSGDQQIIGPEDIFDYIYAVLHSPRYRETYQEFLKIDFPRIPFTDKLDVFWELVAYGRELRGYHLMETIEMDDIFELGLGYMGDGDNTVGKIGKDSYIKGPNISGFYLAQESVNKPNIPDGPKIGVVKINETQCFKNVPEVAWNFYIGGYQPAQKRLKDRKSKTLSYDDIIHYQRIIVALTYTARVMGEIDKVKFL